MIGKGADTMKTYGTDIIGRLARTAETFPDKPAFSDENGSVTFGEVYSAVRKIGTAVARKLPARSGVAVMSGRCRFTPVLFLGIVCAGCFYAPMDAEQPEARLKSILDVLSPSLLIADREHAERARQLGFEGEILISEELAETPADEILLAERSRTACPDDPLYVIFTSGSTGRPKGVITAVQSLVTYIDAYAEVMEIDESDTLGNQSPLDYIAAVRDIYLPIFTGASMYIIPKQCFVMPAKLFGVLNERRITAVGWSVSVFTIAVKVGAFGGGKPEYLKKICFSGSVMPCSVLRVWQENLPDAKFVNQYGPTECTASCTYYEVKERVSDGDTLPIGRPYRGYRVFLLDEDSNPVPAGEQGEICVAGCTLAQGYYNEPELTAASFVRNPLNGAFNELIYKTGDYGVFRKDGVLEFRGRKDRQIKHLGHRVELSEIESAAMALPSMTSACAMYRSEKELIYLFYTGETTAKEAAVHFRSVLPGFMVPRKLVRLEEMPQLANGKTDMQALKQIMENDK